MIIKRILKGLFYIFVVLPTIFVVLYGYSGAEHKKEKGKK